MDELKISPSESAWQNIDKRIQHKSRRRRTVFILFFMALFLLTGGYWLFNSGKNTNTEQNKQISHALKNNREIVIAKKKDSSSIQKTFSNKKDAGSNENNIPKVIFSLNGKDSKNKKQVVLINKRASIISNEMLLKAEIKERFSSDNKINKNPDVEDLLNLKQDNLLDKKVDLAKQDAKSNAQIENVTLEKVNPDSVKDIAGLKKINEEKDTLFSEKSSNISLNKKQKRKWILGITFSGGKSFLANGFLDINNNNLNYSSAPGSVTGGSSSSPLPLPAKTINSAGFIGGAFLEKSISEKSKISIGINYKYFSTINKTGSKIDSVVIAYNSTTYTNSYRNNFNYLELPVSFKFQVTNNKSLPVYWLAGINISQLISSNALQFKSNPGVYYNDNSLINKIQLGFSTGFSATLFSKQKNPVNIGPYFYYNASRLANEGMYNKKHFSFIGISTEILFNKK